MKEQKSIFKTWYFWTLVLVMVLVNLSNLPSISEPSYAIGFLVGILMIPYGVSHIIRYGVSKIKTGEENNE